MHPTTDPRPDAELAPLATPGFPPALGPSAVLIGLDADLPEGLKSPGGYALRTLAIFLCIVMGIAVWMLGVRYLPLPNLWSYTSLAIPVALVAWLLYRWVRSRHLRRLVGDLPKKLVLGSGRESGREGRLLVVGKPALLAPFVRLGPVRDEAFEPIVFFAPRIVKLPRTGTAVMVLTAISVAVLIEVLRRSTTLPFMRPGWLTIMAGVAVGAGVQMLIWPTYLRVAPGRIDVMRFTFGRIRPEVTAVDLRNAQVLVHFKHSTICIRPSATPDAPAKTPTPDKPVPPPVATVPLPESPWIALNLRGVWNPPDVAHAIIRAAASTAPTPPLPDDQLLG